MNLSIWAVTSLQRVFPWTPPASKRLRLLAARGEKVSFQVAFRHDSAWPHLVSIGVQTDGCADIVVREAGLVPLRHANTDTPSDENDLFGMAPCFVPDPLLPNAQVFQEGGVSRSFWISLRVPKDAPVGVQRVTAIVNIENRVQKRLSIALEVVDAECSGVSADFPITHWIYADALCDWYRVRPFESRFWPLLEKYLRNYVEHGSNTLYVPALTPPLDGVRRPAQLLRIQKQARGRLYFDWSDVERWIDIALGLGVANLEWSHLFSQWGATHAIRVYEGDPDAERLLWDPETPADAPIYRAFLTQYLGELHALLKRRGLLDRCYFHLSDEPATEHRANYRAVRELIRDIAPWMRVMDALSDVNYALEGLVDEPVASINHVSLFRDAHVGCHAYFCCFPRGAYLNRLLDTPLAKIRMSGWILHRLQMRGFLHWGFNYWYRRLSRELIDPFTVSDGKAWPDWPYGDTFVVYPGSDGPIDSIRWEVFAESMQDLALLRALGTDPDDASLSVIRSFCDFPKTIKWIHASRSRLLQKNSDSRPSK